MVLSVRAKFHHSGKQSAMFNLTPRASPQHAGCHVPGTPVFIMALCDSISNLGNTCHLPGSTTPLHVFEHKMQTLRRWWINNLDSLIAVICCGNNTNCASNILNLHVPLCVRCVRPLCEKWRIVKFAPPPPHLVFYWSVLGGVEYQICVRPYDVIVYHDYDHWFPSTGSRPICGSRTLFYGSLIFFFVYYTLKIYIYYYYFKTFSKTRPKNLKLPWFV